MKIIIDQAFHAPTQHMGVMRKTLDSELVPTKGAEFEDSAWGNSKRIDSVILNFDEPYYYLGIAPINVKDKAEWESQKEMYKLHGWKPL